MATGAEVDDAVAALDELVRGDGARFCLTGWDDEAGTVELALVVVDATCVDCVVPRPMLESIALTRLRAALPWVATVTVHDPRDG